MKKLISLALILCMACMLIPAMAEESAAGTWYITRMNTNGAEVNPADMGMAWTMVLNEDGTFTSVMEMMGQSQETAGTWVLEDGKVNITVDGNTQSFIFADGTITMDMGEEGNAVFTREAPQPTAKAAVVAAESEDAFLGEWEIAGMDMMGMHLSKDMFSTMGLENFSISLTVTPGKATMASSDPTTGTVQSMEYNTTFADGKLTIQLDMGEAAAAAESAGLDLSSITDGITSIELLEDGNLLYSMNLMGMQVGVNLAPVAAAEEPAA